MKRLVGLLLILLAVVFASASQAATHVDDADRRIEFARPPQRVITLAPNLTEFVYAVGAGGTFAIMVPMRTNDVVLVQLNARR